MKQSQNKNNTKKQKEEKKKKQKPNSGTELMTPESQFWGHGWGAGRNGRKERSKHQVR
jgi:hypothetical protein